MFFGGAIPRLSRRLGGEGVKTGWRVYASKRPKPLKKTDASKFFKKTDPMRVFKKPATTEFLRVEARRKPKKLLQ
jgi:hypothetical protein